MPMSSVAIVGHGVVGKGMERLLSKRFETITYDVGGDGRAVNECDLAIVCVPTPSLPDGSADISMVEEVVSWIDCPLILIKSTVPPGTTDYLRKKYNKKVLFSPEYMGESSYFTPYWKYPDPERAETHTFVIVGGDEASDVLDYFQAVMSVDTRYTACSALEAELTKYMENTFFATKVAFCNEWYDIASSFGVDYKKLRELWLLDSRINPNHTLVFKDKRGFSGKCLPKDLRAILSATSDKLILPLLTSVLSWSR